MPSIVTTPTIENAIATNAPVAFGISGGKDSIAAAFDTSRYLDVRGHQGPRILIHSDLGRVEWRDSLPTCERLSKVLDIPLVVVKRERGDMMDRWLQRFHANMARYQAMETVQLILPWSTPSMRFCTSELKTAIICRDLVARFPQQTILSVQGIRREESPSRAKALPCKTENKLISKTHGTSGYNWLPILDYALHDVWSIHQRERFAPHEAYTTYGNSRVSCAFCIMSSRPDLLAASRCPDNHAIYREMVDLEIVSGFAFQEQGWLGDVAPHLLSEDQQHGLKRAKDVAAERRALETRIPRHLLYTKQWPEWLPTDAEAQILADVRGGMGRLYNVTMQYATAPTIIARYCELLLKAGKSLQHYPTQPTQLRLVA